MKTIKYLLFALLATFVFAGCTDDVTYTPGEGDQPGTYGVYFPAQATRTSFDLDPTDPTEYSYTIKRVRTTGEITVPVVVEASEAGVFEVGEIKFADGQAETTFTVDFSKAGIGKTYKANIRVEDKAYAAVAGQYKTGIDISVIRLQWNSIGTGKWRDEFLTGIMGSNIKPTGQPNAEKDVEIFERDDKPGYYRIKDIYDEAYIRKIVGAFYTNFTLIPDSYTIIDASDKNKIYMPAQSTGYNLSSFFSDSNGQTMHVSLCEENFPSFDASQNKYGTIDNGIITFPNGAVIYTCSDIWQTAGFYLKSSNIMRLMLPGAREYDYTVALTKSEPVDGVVTIGATFGADVAKMKYAFFEGTLSDGTASLYANDMNDGKTAFDGEITAAGTIKVTMEETGVYTIIGCNYDENGSMKSYSFLPFGYIKAGEEKPVVLSVRTELTWENEAAGHTPENSIKAILFGEEIESGFYGLIATDKIAGMTEAQLTTLIKGGNAIKEEYLAKINGTGWLPLFTKLDKGTSYTLLVWAYNGYYGKLFTAEQTTEGAVDPLQKKYTFDDVTGGVPKADLLNTAWNYYAIDVGEEKTSRGYLGKVTFSEAADGAEEDGTPIDYINVTGLNTLKLFSSYKGDDTMKASWDTGIVYLTALNDLQMFSTYYVTNFFTWEEKPTGLHTIEGALVGAYVGDGIVAFVPNPNYVEAGYTFTGIYCGAFSDAEYSKQVGYLTIYKHLILVNPTVDPNGKKAAAIAKALSGLRPATNYVELRGLERARALIDQTVGKPATRSASSIEGAVTARPAVPVQSSFTEGAVLRSNADNGSQTLVRSNVSLKRMM